MGPVNARSGGPQATRPRKQGLAQSCMVRKVELAPRVLGGRDGPLRQERFQGSSRCASSNGGGGARGARSREGLDPHARRNARVPSTAESSASGVLHCPCQEAWRSQELGAHVVPRANRRGLIPCNKEVGSETRKKGELAPCSIHRKGDSRGACRWIVHPQESSPRRASRGKSDTHRLWQ